MKRTTAPNSVGGLYVDDTGVDDGTLVIKEDKNLTQEEIVNVAEMTGNTLNGSNDEQMKEAILETAGKVYTYSSNDTFTLQTYDKKPTILLTAGITALTLAVAASVNESQRILIVNVSGAAVTLSGAIAASIPINNLGELDLYYDTNSAQFRIIDKNLIGAGAPSSTPSFIGQKYYDTTNLIEYIAKGISASSDWISSVLSGSGAPSSTPTFIGQRYVDTTGNREYFAIGVATSADWRKVARYEYGTVTVVAGGSDVTVSLDFDWTDGIIIVMRSIVAASYFDNGTPTVLIEATYDALTNAAYTNHHEMAHSDPSGHTSAAKTTALIGLPNAATPNSVTFDDAGGTDAYIKYVILA